MKPNIEYPKCAGMERIFHAKIYSCSLPKSQNPSFEISKKNKNKILSTVLLTQLKKHNRTVVYTIKIFMIQKQTSQLFTTNIGGVRTKESAHFARTDQDLCLKIY